MEVVSCSSVVRVRSPPHQIACGGDIYPFVGVYELWDCGGVYLPCKGEWFACPINGAEIEFWVLEVHRLACVLGVLCWVLVDCLHLSSACVFGYHLRWTPLLL